MKQNPYIFSLLVGLLFVSTAAAQTEKQSLRISETEKKQVVELVGRRLIDFYVYPDIARQMAAAISKNYDDGVYQSITDPELFAGSLTKDLRNVSSDGHLDMWFDPPRVIEIRKAAGNRNEPSAEVWQKRIKEAQKNNFGFREIKILEGNIGYLNLTGFTDLKLGSAEVAAAAMNFLGNTDALIIDLRQNGGGYAEMVSLLASYLFDEKPILLSDFYTRDGGKEKLEQEWTLAKVSGKRRSKTDVYLLTANRTFSAAESFAYSLQGYKRAIVVGEKTGGGAHILSEKIVNDRFVIEVPDGRPVDPNTKTNWEKTGVKPDIETAPQDALPVAHIKALEKLSSSAADSAAKFSYEWLLVELKNKRSPFQPDEAALRSFAGNYTGAYGQRKITFENGRLFSQRIKGAKVALIPLAANLFTFEGRNEFRIKINVENNRVTGLTSIAMDGSIVQETKDPDS